MRCYRLVDQERAHHAVSLLCSVLGVSRQAYYAWRGRVPSARELRDRELKALVAEVFKQSRRTYGAPRVAKTLRRKRGQQVATKRVARLMGELGLRGLSRGRKGRGTTVQDPVAAAAPDLLERDFTAAAPNLAWVADITYVRCYEGWLYLAIVMDLFSRKIVGWSMRDTLEAEIVSDALAMSVARRRPAAGVIHHSDRGSQGGFNWSSQRLDEEGCDGSSSATCGRSCGAASDAVAGSAVGGAAGGAAAVLAGDRSRRLERGGGRRGWRVGGGWRPVVSRGWRDAAAQPAADVGSLLVVQRAGRDRAASRARRGSAGDRAAARSFAVDDLARAAS